MISDEDSVAVIHTHWSKNGNLSFSEAYKGEYLVRGDLLTMLNNYKLGDRSGYYLVNRNGVVKYTKPDSTNVRKWNIVDVGKIK